MLGYIPYYLFQSLFYYSEDAAMFDILAPPYSAVSDFAFCYIKFRPSERTLDYKSRFPVFRMIRWLLIWQGG